MINNKYSKLFISSIGALLLLGGCSEKELEVPKENLLSKHTKNKAYKFNYVPIIGTQTPDDKVMVDMGVILRVWINSYKNRDDSLVASHDIYEWVRKPDFIVGNELPIKQRGLITPQGKLPFLLSNKSVDRSDTKSNKNIRNFVNSVYDKKVNQTISDENMQEINKFDKQIKEFITSNKKGDK